VTVSAGRLAEPALEHGDRHFVGHPVRADLQERYFAGRADGLRPFTAESLVTARVI